MTWMLQDEAATPYLNACQYAAKSSEFFKHFKSHPAYTHVLEHVSYEEGQQYLKEIEIDYLCLLYTSPSPRDRSSSRMPSSA